MLERPQFRAVQRLDVGVQLLGAGRCLDEAGREPLAGGVGDEDDLLARQVDVLGATRLLP
ncbi:MAG: hypothetical protein V5A37_03805 [Halobacteriales archaeon]